MIDCPNGMMRDRLPDLLHGRLGAAERAEVEAHVRGCAECEAELALLAELRGVLHAAPAVDTAAIVAALPPAASRSSVHASRTRWSAWRAAAAIALVAGGTSIVVMRTSQAPSSDVRPVAVATAPSSQLPATPVVTTPAPRATPEHEEQPVVTATPGAAHHDAAVTAVAHPRELAVGGASVGDLSDQELSALLSEMESLDATPSLEVEGGIPVTPVAPGKEGA